MSMQQALFRAMVVGWLAFLQVNPGHAVTAALSANADTYLRDATVGGALTFMDVRGGSEDFRGYLRFDLSVIPTSATINSATLDLFQVLGASRNDTISTSRFALYGLDNSPGNTAQNWDEATLVIGNKGTEDVTSLTGVTDLDHNVVGITESTITGSPPNGTIRVTGAPLANFLQTRLGDGKLTTFILSNDDAADQGFGIGTKENVDVAKHSVLTIDYSIPPGDFNFDGIVDAADYIVWRKTDATEPGFETWRAQFGQPTIGGAAASSNVSVPEPTTAMMLILLVAGMSTRRRGRARRISKLRTL